MGNIVIVEHLLHLPLVDFAVRIVLLIAALLQLVLDLLQRRRIDDFRQISRAQPDIFHGLDDFDQRGLVDPAQEALGHVSVHVLAVLGRGVDDGGQRDLRRGEDQCRVGQQQIVQKPLNFRSKMETIVRICYKQ